MWFNVTVPCCKRDRPSVIPSASTPNSTPPIEQGKESPIGQSIHGGFCRDLALYEATRRGSGCGNRFSDVVPMGLVGHFEA
jgi:hypothetical protein